MSIHTDNNGDDGCEKICAWRLSSFSGGEYALTIQDGWDPDCIGDGFKSIGISSSRCGVHGTLDHEWIVSDSQGFVIGRMRGNDDTSGVLTITSINQRSYQPHPDDVVINIEEDEFFVRVPGSIDCECVNDIGYMRIETSHGRVLYEIMRTFTDRCKECDEDGCW